MDEEERRKEILECLFGAWAKNGMPLYGGYCYQEVFDLMQSFGVDTTEAETGLKDFEERAKQIAERLERQS